MGESADSCPGAGNALPLLGTDQAACASPGAALHGNRHTLQVCLRQQRTNTGQLIHFLCRFVQSEAADVPSNML
jgi:hypothetical protein